MEEQEPKYKISLKGPGITYEEDVDRAVFDEVHQLMVLRRTSGSQQPVESEQTRVAELWGSPPTDADGREIWEFIVSHNARRNPDKIVAVALFLKERHNRTLVARQELQRKLDAAGFHCTNFGRDLHWTCEVKWLKSVQGSRRLKGKGGKKTQTLRLTEAGISAVQAKFDEGTLRRSRQPR